MTCNALQLTSVILHKVHIMDKMAFCRLMYERISRLFNRLTIRLPSHWHRKELHHLKTLFSINICIASKQARFLRAWGFCYSSNDLFLPHLITYNGTEYRSNIRLV